MATLAQEHAQTAIDTLAACLSDPKASWAARVSAAAELLDRGFGRAPQAINATATISLAEEFEAFIRTLRREGDTMLVGQHRLGTENCLPAAVMVPGADLD